MMSKQNVPELRFPEFSGEWESVSIQDLYEENYSGGTPKTSVKEYWNGNIPWIQSSDLTIDSLKTVNVRKHITSQAISNSATKLVPKNSIAIVTRVGVGKLAYINYDFATSQDFISLSGVKSDINFTLYILYKLLKRELSALQGTSIKGMTKKELINKSIFLPELDEQKKIGDLLNKIDRLIELEEKKLELLEEQKKGYMQKIFSQELRFKDENGNDYPKWKDYYLKEISERITRKNTNLSTERPLTISGELGLVDQITYFSKSVSSKNLANYTLIKEGEFAYNKSYSRGYPFGAIKRLEKYKKGALSTLYICFKIKENYDSNFMKHYFDSSKWHREVSTIAVEGARNHGLLNIPVNEFFNIRIKMPSVKEQRKIAEFLSLLDNNIISNSKKLNNLKEEKKGLIQNMFI